VGRRARPRRPAAQLHAGDDRGPGQDGDGGDLRVPARVHDAQQVGAFAVLAVAAVFAGMKLRRRPSEPLATTDVNLGSARLVGQRVRLETAIANGRGTVRIGDTTWQVTGPDLPAGTAERVVASDGIVLALEPSTPLEACGFSSRGNRFDG
ncbi:MAG: NfeD family protein, partial [Alphaproteobacteria bacterium]